MAIIKLRVISSKHTLFQDDLQLSPEGISPTIGLIMIAQRQLKANGLSNSAFIRRNLKGKQTNERDGILFDIGCMKNTT